MPFETRPISVKNMAQKINGMLNYCGKIWMSKFENQKLNTKNSVPFKIILLFIHIPNETITGTTRIFIVTVLKQEICMKYLNGSFLMMMMIKNYKTA